MISKNLDPAYLVLEDGTFFQGISFGHKGLSMGEVVFNTGTTGYQEVLTDPSYFGQLVAFTYPEIGNTGINAKDNESENISVKGLIVRQYSHFPSSWRSQQNIESWLLSQKVVGISDIDTRSLVRHLREYGSMNAVISSLADIPPIELHDKLKMFPKMEGLNLAEKVTTKEIYLWNKTCDLDFNSRIINKNPKPFKVIAIDYGIKKSILQRLVAHGCEVIVLPSTTNLELINSYQPEGVFLSNGPGDPSAVKNGISLAKRLIEETNLPLFGICLGHQIIGLALGGDTFKLRFGHRGLNHPCGSKSRLEITSQNHGFALDPDSFDNEQVDITHYNLNDNTVAGISLREKPVFGIQYHPEASPGPHDADHHFSRFVSLMQERR